MSKPLVLEVRWADSDTDTQMIADVSFDDRDRATRIVSLVLTNSCLDEWVPVIPLALTESVERSILALANEQFPELSEAHYALRAEILAEIDSEARGEY